jgi:hypothetical protein
MTHFEVKQLLNWNLLPGTVMEDRGTSIILFTHVELLELRCCGQLNQTQLASAVGHAVRNILEAHTWDFIWECAHVYKWKDLRIVKVFTNFIWIFAITFSESCIFTLEVFKLRPYQMKINLMPLGCFLWNQTVCLGWRVSCDLILPTNFVYLVGLENSQCQKIFLY